MKSPEPAEMKRFSALKNQTIAMVLMFAINAIPGCSNYSPDEPVIAELPPIVMADSNQDNQDTANLPDENSAGDTDAIEHTDAGWEDSAVADASGDAVPDDAAASEETELSIECPGGFYCECDGPSDCYSSLCAPFTDHNRCTVMCSDDVGCEDDMLCAPFSVSGPDTIYACLYKWPTACRPCVDDKQCEVSWTGSDRQPKCIKTADNGSFCAPVCDDNDDCPAAYVCVRENRGLQDTGFCYPDTGVCPCNDFWQHTGYETTCENTNEFGTCTGLRLCQEQCPAMVPEAEKCDGIDNNCDGRIDEDLDGRPCDIVGEWGICQGKSTCVNGAPVCLGEKATKEICNGVDDDCDGQVDEDLGSTECGIGICKKIVPDCVNGRPVFCNAQEGMRLETCNGVDDDCDGSTDEDMGKIFCGTGECARNVPACAAGRPNICMPGTPALSERCDGLDNNCDGRTDEGIAAMTCGQGICRHSVAGCVNGHTNQCNPFQGMTAETCNGLDDDCDGESDDNITSSIDGYESNPNCGFPKDLGVIYEGDAQMVFKATAYPGTDIDWFRFTAAEKDHSCVWGTDQDYSVTIYMFEPTGPAVDARMVLELWTDSCQKLASSSVNGAVAELIQYKWDGECGPNDSRSFRIKIAPTTKDDARCLPYTVYVSMRKN